MIDLSRTFASELAHTSPPREFLFLHPKLSGLYHTLAELGEPMDLAPYLERFTGGAGKPKPT